MSDDSTPMDPTRAAVAELAEQIERLEKAINRHLENTNTANKMIGAIMQSAGELNDMIHGSVPDD